MSEKKDLKIIFMGTPEFAAAVLENLLAEEYDIFAVFTQPDKKVGRRQEITLSPVKKLALARGITVIQPVSLRDKSVADEISGLCPDIIVVAAYGKILPKNILAVPRFGAINVHASLLSKYRGASPIQEALLSGDKETGVTIMLMDEGMDTGDVLAQKKVKIVRDDTAISLQKKLATSGSKLLEKTIPDWVAGKIDPTKQDGATASYCKIISKADGKINWEEPAEMIYRKWRAYQPWPGIFTIFKKKRLKLTEIAVQSAESIREKPGKVIEYKQVVAVAAKKDLVILKRVQFEGKNEMGIEEFLRGQKNFIGEILE